MRNRKSNGKMDGWGANNEGQIDLPVIAVEFQAMAEFV